MAIRITDECINCGACEPECPNGAIYEPGSEWRYSDKTNVNGVYTNSEGKEIGADDANPALSNDFYFVISDKCTECVGFFDEPKCASVCPVDCCIKDEAHEETKEQLTTKKSRLHD